MMKVRNFCLIRTLQIFFLNCHIFLLNWALYLLHLGIDNVIKIPLELSISDDQIIQSIAVDPNEKSRLMASTIFFYFT